MKYTALNFTANLKSSIQIPSSAIAAQKRLLLIGDSTTYGKGANPSGAGAVEGAHVNSPARLLADALSSNGVTADSKSVVGLGNNSDANATELYFNATPDVNLTLNGWGVLKYNSIGGDIFVSATPANILRFEFDNVNRIAFGLPMAGYGTIEYRVDGGSWIAIPEVSAPDALSRVQIDFETVGLHNVEFRATAVTNIYVVYCESWNTSDEVVIVPWGARGYTTSNLNTSTRPWSYKSALEYVPFDAVLINIGINDVKIGAATTETTYTTNVTAYIDAVLAVNPDADIFLQIPNDINGGLDFAPSVLTTLAGTYGATLLDSRLAPDMDTYANAVAAGKMVDDFHPSDTGYAAIWNYFEPTIRGVLS